MKIGKENLVFVLNFFVYIDPEHFTILILVYQKEPQ